MVAIAEKINSSAGTAIKQEHNHQTARIIQWLGGERAGTFNQKKRGGIYSPPILLIFILVDVPAEFDVTSSLKEDFVDHQIVASKVECIELLRLKPLVSR
jgi:hypothetical protein